MWKEFGGEVLPLEVKTAKEEFGAQEPSLTVSGVYNLRVDGCERRVQQ